MRSVLDSTDPDDLTARARTREAAITLFSEHGYAATSVRQIALLAGVSPALVMHHFGSKDDLRRSCDDRVVAVLRDARSGPIADQLPAEGHYGRYLARMVTEGTPAGNELFDRLIAETRTMIDESVGAGRMNAPSDRRALAAVLVVNSLAPLVLGAQLARTFGEDALSSATLRSLAVPTADIYTRGLFTTDELVVAVREEGLR